MRQIMIALAASMMLWSGNAACSPRVTVILDPRIPHEVAKEVEMEVWARRADGTMAKQRVRVPPGYWVAGPPVIEEMPK